MFYYLKKIATNIALLCVIVGSLSAASILDNPPPIKDFPECPFAASGSEFLAKKAEIEDWFKGVDPTGVLFKTVFPSGLPQNKLTHNSQNPKTTYATWHNSKFAVSGASAAIIQQTTEQLKQSAQELEQANKEKERIRLEAEQKEREILLKAEAEKHALTLSHQRQREQELATHLSTLAAVSAGGGGAYTHQEINDLVAAITNAREVVVNGMVFDDVTTTVNVDVSVNGKPMPLNVSGLSMPEYSRLKLFLGIFAKMNSATFNAASGAMSDLITDILSSAQPQEYHFVQATQLASVSGRLDKYLKYHQNLAEKFTKWQALPLDNFLKISFADATTVNAARQQVEDEFAAIVSAVPREGIDQLPLGSLALAKFIDKIHSSILLPTEVEFSETEIEDIFKELGLLLEIDDFGGFVINDEYYSKLLDFNNGVNELKAKMLKKDKDLFESSDARRMFEDIDAAIATGVLVELSDDFQDIFQRIYKSFNDPMNIEMTGMNLKVKISELQSKLQSKTLPTIVSLPYQDSGFSTQRIKEKNYESVKAVLFLMQKFAKDQFDSVSKRSIVGNIVPALQAICTAYYGTPWTEIKDALLDFTRFAFDENEYKKVKKSENVAFMKVFLDHLIASSSVMTVDLDQLKRDVLRVQTDPTTKMRMDLVLRTCELITENDFKKGKLTRKEVEKIARSAEYFGNPLLQDAVFRYELQDNGLENESDKKRFLDSYLAVNLEEGTGLVSIPERKRRLGDFFRDSLAAKALGTDFVKLVLTLPLIKEKYVEAYQAFGDAANLFSESTAASSASSASSRSVTRTAAFKRDFFDKNQDHFNQDEKTILSSLLTKLVQLEVTSRDFLMAGNDAQALSTNTSSAVKKASTGFSVSSGLSQLEFESVRGSPKGSPNIFSHNAYYGAFYNAIKVLHYIDLSMPSEADFIMLKTIVQSKGFPDALTELEAIIVLSENLRKHCKVFYQQITKLMQFVENFNAQKEKYDDPTGTEVLDVYGNIDGLRVSDPLILASLAEANKEERYYTDAELRALGISDKARNEYGRKQVDGETPEVIRTEINKTYGTKLTIVYEENVASSAPKPSMMSMFGGAKLGGAAGGGFSLAGLRKPKASSNNDFVYADPAGVAANLLDWFANEASRMGGVDAQSPTADRMALYQHFASAQQEYLRQIDFSKLTKEEDSLYLARQLLAAIDLYLRIAVHAKFVAERDAISETAQNPRRGALTRTIAKLESTYFDMNAGKYTISSIIKAYKTPGTLNPSQTTDLLKMIKAIHPDLKALIGNEIIALFNAGSPDVISSVTTAIDTYLGAKSLAEVISIKVE